MQFPLGFWDVSLLLAIAAIIMLVTSELLSPYHGRISILINKKRLKNTAFVLSFLFLMTVAVRVIAIIIGA